MPGLRTALVLALGAVLAGGLAGLAVADPFHLRHIRWFTAALVLLAVLLVTAAFAVPARRVRLRALVVAVGAVAALGWVGVVAAANQLTVENREVASVADDGRRLVVVEGRAPSAGPVHAVVVRAGSGLFEQETVVYQGAAAAPAPADVRFVDADTVEVLTTAGCVYRSEVEALTLAVNPVHRPLHPFAC